MALSQLFPMSKIFLALALSIILSGCSSLKQSKAVSTQPAIAKSENNSTAQITQVQATGEANNYTFAVTISSPDTGCDRYADWWEVITPEGELLYRRVLLHSHVDEQPFERTGGKVNITPEQEVIVRVHMSIDGYSPIAQKGSVASGFGTVTLEQDFATNLESVEPLPQDCAF